MVVVESLSSWGSLLHHCTTSPLTPNSKWFEPKTMQYTTIDPEKDKDSNPRHALHHHWPQERQRFEPTTMHYTTIDPISQIFEPTTMHYTTIDPRKVRLEPKTIVGSPVTSSVVHRIMPWNSQNYRMARDREWRAVIGSHTIEVW
jgi:hypothetical protein